MAELFIRVGADTASDSWGFVGTVSVGDVEAFRTLEAFSTPAEATKAAQVLMSDVLGEMLAGREWRQVRDETGRPPLRRDFNFSAFSRRSAGSDDAARSG